MNTVYLDHHATTPVDPRVRDAMAAYEAGQPANPGSTLHLPGLLASEAVEAARADVADVLGAHAHNVVFTSGATEANNLALQGAFLAAQRRAIPGAPPPHIITTATEHKAVLDVAKSLRGRGASLTVLRVGADGRVNPADVEAALRPETLWVSVAAVNNEIGQIQPLAAIGAMLVGHGAIFHVDAAQALGRIPVDPTGWNADLVSLSGHKMYGPAGIGALLVAKDVMARIDPLVIGGSQEYGLRPGTLNGPGIIGFAAAAKLAQAERDRDATRMRDLRAQLWTGLQALGGVTLNGTFAHRVEGNLSVVFDGVEGGAFRLALGRHVAMSAASACSSKSLATSHVLKAIGVGADAARRTVRFGLGRTTTAADIERTLAVLTELLAAFRA